MSDNLYLQDEGGERRFFTMVPNIIDDLGLSPYAYRLYGRLKRRAGEEGVCFENTQNLAVACKMSTGMVSKAKKELEEAGLIKVAIRSRGHGEFDGHDITIVDIWLENILKYASPVHQVNRSHSCGEQDRSPGEPKNNPIKKNKKKKNNPNIIDGGAVGAPGEARRDMTSSSFSELAEDERAFLELVEAFFSVDLKSSDYKVIREVELTTNQANNLLKLWRQHRNKGSLPNLVDCIYYYAEQGEVFDDALIIRIRRALKNWKDKSRFSFDNYFESLLVDGQQEIML